YATAKRKRLEEAAEKKLIRKEGKGKKKDVVLTQAQDEEERSWTATLDEHSSHPAITTQEPSRFFAPVFDSSSKPFIQVISTVLMCLSAGIYSTDGNYNNMSLHTHFWHCGEVVMFLNMSLKLMSDAGLVSQLAERLKPSIDTLLRVRQPEPLGQRWGGRSRWRPEPLGRYLNSGIGSYHGSLDVNTQFLMSLRHLVACKEITDCMAPELVSQFTFTPETEKFLAPQLHVAVALCGCLVECLEQRQRTESEEEEMEVQLRKLYGFWHNWSTSITTGSPFRISGTDKFEVNIRDMTQFFNESVEFVKGGEVAMRRYEAEPTGKKGKRPRSGGWAAALGDPTDPTVSIFAVGDTPQDVADVVTLHLRMIHVLPFRLHSYIENWLKRQPPVTFEDLMKKMAKVRWGWEDEEVEKPTRSGNRSDT
ncbi:hypothetical protein TeGR_g3444, partial [Tetraparma gracilis]